MARGNGSLPPPPSPNARSDQRAVPSVYQEFLKYVTLFPEVLETRNRPPIDLYRLPEHVLHGGTGGGADLGII